MPLVEVIRGPRTTEAALVAVETFARSLGKIPVRCEDAPGFLVNRVLGAYLNEAVRLLEDGYSPEVMDQAIRDFGMPMGPLELIDEVGHDVAAKVSNILHKEFGERARPPETLSGLGKDPAVLGRKAGRGFYIHEGQGRGGKLKPNAALLEKIRRKQGSYKTPTAGLWVKRLIYPMINEAAMALQDGVVATAAEIDLAMVFGTGFAPFRGGPLRYADSLGIATIVETLKGFGEERLNPCELLEQLAESEDGFYPSTEPQNE
jgi:3-hydroxyacyl-CoA dehydrogenase/enoyl-CoA hydratase/3-hydroxybutyryl-CoA epimerase